MMRRITARFVLLIAGAAVAPLVIYGFYGLVIVLSAAFQGGLAAYYFTRRRPLEAFNLQTPDWVRQVLAEANS